MRRRCLPIVMILFGLLAASCGGGDTDDPNVADGGSSDEGEFVIGGDLELPDYFPADFYVPDSVTIRSVSESPASNMISLSGSFEGDADAVRADMRDGLVAAGYELINEDEDFTVFIKDGVGRIRIRARDFLGEPTLTVDIDTWTDEQIAELRALTAEEIVTTGRATANIAGETVTAEGECRMRGPNVWFLAGDASVTLQIDDTQPDGIYADVTLPDGRVFTIDRNSTPQFGYSGNGLSASGAMVEFNYEAAGTVDFAIEATCDS